MHPGDWADATERLSLLPAAFRYLKTKDVSFSRAFWETHA